MSKIFPKMVYIIPNFIVLHFGVNFMKIRKKIAKLKMHENLHKNYPDSKKVGKSPSLNTIVDLNLKIYYLTYSLGNVGILYKVL